MLGRKSHLLAERDTMRRPVEGKGLSTVGAGEGQQALKESKVRGDAGCEKGGVE